MTDIGPIFSDGPARSEKRRVLIVDDQTLVRDGLRALLEHDGTLEVVGAAGDGSDVVRSINTLKADLVLIDISMRSMDGLSAIREIKRRSADTKALVLTEHNTEPQIRAALQAGADGYVLKEASRAELLMAIESVLSGKRFISPSVAAHIVSRYLEHGRKDTTGSSLLDSLTAREKQVLKLIAEGRRNREIASYLFISVKTVEKHRSNLMHKMNLHNTAALTSFALEKGLVGMPSAERSAATAESPRRRSTDV
jgi:DNA-binding NarL/FixJ family response regulator